MDSATIVLIQAWIGLTLAAVAGAVSLYCALRLRQIGRRSWQPLVIGGVLLFLVALILGLDLFGELRTFIAQAILVPLTYVLWTTIALWALAEWREWRVQAAWVSDQQPDSTYVSSDAV